MPRRRSTRKYSRRGYRGLHGSGATASRSQIPNGTMTVDLTNRGLTSLPRLPNSLGGLEIGGNKLTKLPRLPPDLRVLDIGENLLTNITELPNSLRILDIGKNPLRSIAPIPASVTRLSIHGLENVTIPMLGRSLESLSLEANKGVRFQLVGDNPRLDITVHDLYIDGEQAERDDDYEWDVLSTFYVRDRGEAENEMNNNFNVPNTFESAKSIWDQELIPEPNELRADDMLTNLISQEAIEPGQEYFVAKNAVGVYRPIGTRNSVKQMVDSSFRNSTEHRVYHPVLSKHVSAENVRRTVRSGAVGGKRKNKTRKYRRC